jgi:ABC-type sugar transport system ATPase subunit
VLHQGEVKQAGTPQSLYLKPQHRFVAGFVGSPPMNFIQGVVEDGNLRLPDSDWLLASVTAPPGRYEVGVRPEQLVMAETGLEFNVDFSELHGADQYLFGTLSGQTLTARYSGTERSSSGSIVKVQLHGFHLFDPETGTRVGGTE